MVDRAKEIITDRFSDAEGKEALGAALRAARFASTENDNVALASEAELDDEANADGSSDEEDYGAEGSTSDDAETGGSGSGKAKITAGSDEKAADGDESGTGEKADNKESSSGTIEDKIEGEDSTGAGLKPVAGKNAATSEPREAFDTGGKVTVLVAGALLLAAGVYVAHSTFWR